MSEGGCENKISVMFAATGHKPSTTSLENQPSIKTQNKPPYSIPGISPPTTPSSKLSPPLLKDSLISFNSGQVSLRSSHWLKKL